jgi:hypothetical protein
MFGLPIVLLLALTASNINALVTSARSARPSFIVRMASDDTEVPKVEKSKSTLVDPAVRSRLLAESIAPWRTVRLFFYGSLGSGAALGGFITLTGVLAALSGARPDLDLNTEVCPNREDLISLSEYVAHPFVFAFTNNST